MHFLTKLTAHVSNAACSSLKAKIINLFFWFQTDIQAMCLAMCNHGSTGYVHGYMCHHRSIGYVPGY
jgi:hypothetical protein